jgi:hypothetical protein
MTIEEQAKELAAFILDRFEMQKDEQGRKGTEGVTCGGSGIARFGNDSNNHFGEPIRFGLTSFGNSYADGALEDVRHVLTTCRQILGLPPQEDESVHSVRVVNGPEL